MFKIDMVAIRDEANLAIEIEDLKSERTALLATEQNLRQANAELLRWIEQKQDEATTLMAKHWGKQ